MIKKKAKKKSKGKGTSRKKSRSGKQMDPAKVRQDIAGIVKSRAKQITKAVADKASHGELAPARFLLEMAGVYPPLTDGSMPSADEESLAKTLLDRLNIPDDPVVHDQYERGEDVMVIPARPRPDGDRENTPADEKKDEALVAAE